MQVEVGSIVEGKITGLAAFGAFVELPDGKTGLVHISEVSSEYVENIKDHLKEGQTVKVKVVSIEPGGKIALSIKKAILVPDNKHSSDNKGGKFPKDERANKGFKGSPSVFSSPRNKKPAAPLTFEDKMLKFKQDSDEKMHDLKRNVDSKRGGSYRRA